MTPETFKKVIVDPGLFLLGERYATPPAKVLLVAIAGQESRIAARRQRGGGPARSYWQIEPQTASAVERKWLPAVTALKELNIKPFQPRAAVQNWLEYNDLAACVIARGILALDPLRLPGIGDESAAWRYYVERTWRPGRPHRASWRTHYQAACAVCSF